MSVLARSVGNAFRNKVRTAAVVAVLAVAIGLALAMLVANQAVTGKVAELNASVGTVLTVNPAGGQGFEGGGEPLTSAQAATAAAVPNVSSVVGTKALRLRNAAEIAAEAASGRTGQGGPGGQSATSVTTSLTAAVDAGTLGNRNQATSGTSGNGTTQAAPAFSLPVTATGIGAEVDSTGKALQLTQGTGLGNYTAASTGALLGTTLAEKNGLSVGSTFTIQDQTFTVKGLFDAGTAFGNNALYVTLPTAQTLAALPGELSTMIVTVNSMENVDAAKTALQAALGSDKADVTQGQRNLADRRQLAGQRQEYFLHRLRRGPRDRRPDHPPDHGHAGPRTPPRDRRPEGHRRPQPHHRPAVRPGGPRAGGPGQRGGRRRRLLCQRRHRQRPHQLEQQHDGGGDRPARRAPAASRAARAGPSAGPASC